MNFKETLTELTQKYKCNINLLSLHHKTKKLAPDLAYLSQSLTNWFKVKRLKLMSSSTF